MSTTEGIITTTILISMLYKYSIGLSGYSGQGTGPMFGDYEAQRMWLSRTLHLPVHQWYFYDLQYWGLDYPPLTAYHSWLLGKLANVIDPTWVALTSKGFESDYLKIFMRLSALATDALIYLPAILYFAKTSNPTQQKQIILWTLLCPAFAIIDHGHFQYNSAMLGLSLLAFTCFLNARYGIGSFFFVCSLMFKQMALYYALPVFFYLLGICYHAPSRRTGILLLCKLGIVVIGTFALLLSPFLSSSPQLFQIIHRVFPVARGIYEDKVGNAWFALSVFVKIRNILSLDRLVQLSLLATVLAILPSCLYLFTTKNPSSTQFLYTLSISSLGFFLFSFQVHEKHILLALMPITLLSHQIPFLSSWFNNLAMFSLWPLLQKDQLQIPYLACLILWNTATKSSWVSAPKLLQRSAIVSYILIGLLHLAELYIAPPARYPDLYIVLNSLFSAAAFGMFFIILHSLLLSSAAAPTTFRKKAKKE